MINLAAQPIERLGSRAWARFRVPVRLLLVPLITVTLVASLVAPSGAITGGEPDNQRHPYVGGTVLYYPPFDETFVNCTGSLISATVFLTSAHCYRNGPASISLDEVFNPETSTRYSGTFIAHPTYNPAHEFKNDVAVIVLHEPVPGVDPAQLPRLPEAGQLDRMRADETLTQSTRFTSVGFGTRGYEPGIGGMKALRGQSRYVSVGSFSALTPAMLHLSQNPARGDGGTCDGDSGGPNFIGAGDGETRVIASLTATGETYCKATNVTYRLDTESSRQFLSNYVTLP